MRLGNLPWNWLVYIYIYIIIYIYIYIYLSYLTLTVKLPHVLTHANQQLLNEYSYMYACATRGSYTIFIHESMLGFLQISSLPILKQQFQPPWSWP